MSAAQKCFICKMSNDDDVDVPKFEFKIRKDISVHYFCLLLTTGLIQRGSKKKKSIEFFLPFDIRAASKQAEEFSCIFCKKNSASIACTFPECQSRFHLICGFKNSCLFEFEKEFPSKCPRHHGIVDEYAHTEDTECYVCFQPMGPYNPVTSILPKCCKIGFIHRNCLMEYAYSAGYYLKCLLCKNPEFRNEVRRRGVFVPDRDAKWELEKGAFAEIYFTHTFCDITNCACPFGREFVDTKKWKFFKCIHCGATGTHKACFEMIDIKKGFECFQCRRIVYKNNLETTVVNLDETFDVCEENNENSIFSEKLRSLREAFQLFISTNPTVAEAYDDTEAVSESSVPELEKNVVEDSEEEETNPIYIQRKKTIDEQNMRSYMLSRFMKDDEA